jgi:hypothetical protein
MKKHLLGIAHLIALISIYVMAYILSGQITNLASGIPKEIEYNQNLQTNQ